MSLFKQEAIECLCCKNSISTPDVNGVYRCKKCQSEIIKTYDNQSKREQVKGSLVVLASSIVASIAVTMADSLLGIKFIEYVVFFFIFLVLFSVIFRVPILSGDKPKTVYIFADGASYPDQQRTKHKGLIKWLSESEKDYIGFVRYIVNSQYVRDHIDEEGLKFFKEVNLKTELLPSAKQVENWRSPYLSDDLKTVRTYKEKYLSEFNFHVNNLRALAEGVDYFSA